MDRIELIKALIVFGADVEIHNDLGETPGLIAARSSKGKKQKAVRSPTEDGSEEEWWEIGDSDELLQQAM